MINIYANSFVGKKYFKSYLDDNFALKIALSMFDCEDCKTVDVVDGFTGEVIYTFEK